MSWSQENKSVFLPVNTRSGAPQCEACWVKSFVFSKYGNGMMKVYWETLNKEMFLFYHTGTLLAVKSFIFLA
jgi:hypothetical protein